MKAVPAEWDEERGFTGYRNNPRLETDRLADALSASGLVILDAARGVRLLPAAAAAIFVRHYLEQARHGTRTRYEYGCRCLACRTANADYVSERRHGRPATLCSCDRPTYRPEAMERRRASRRCSGCHYTVHYCTCEPADVSRATSERPS